MTHPACKGRRVAMLFKSYSDDSADRDGSTFGVGGFVGPEIAWGQLEPKWLAALPSDMDYFHATDCFSGNNQFEPSKGWKIERRKELIGNLTDLICETDIKLIGHAIDVPYYIQKAPKKIENNFLGNKYVACFDANVQNICRDYMSPQGSSFPAETGDVCAFFYEESIYATSVTRHVMLLKEDKELWYRSRIGNPTSGTKTGSGAIPLLQVADLGAFLGTKHAAEAADQRIPWRPYWDKLWNAGRIWGFPRLTKQKLSFLYAIFGIQQKPELLDEVWPESK